ncbi:HEPN domain-containing protein [Candidatus Cryosericum septentrionale]|uniref:Uncharacterized protein n=1 Tax=Candidatus Cryosericum septentrionale TaxID=2290913 RepID=A0A398DV63_9BACT|nr:HEPN domain-containing protein [Candidatus Cryosericum septentrionale]RIE15867.1 hypothetical protein SMC1_09215 [Candidatus Cryosericum septentrionale]
MPQEESVGTDSRFLASLKTYVPAALAHLDSRHPPVDPAALEEKPECIMWTAPSGQQCSRDRRRLVLEDELHNLAEYDALLAAIESDPAVAAVVGNWLAAGGMATYIDQNEVADDPVRQMAVRLGSFACDQNELDATCKAQERRLRSSTVDQTLVAILFGFDAERAPLQLRGGVEVDALNEDELRFCEFEGFNGRWTAPRFGVRFRRALTRAIGDENIVHATGAEGLAFQTEGHSAIQRVIEALRVFQAGDFASPGVFRYSWFHEFPVFSIAFDQRSRFLDGYHLGTAQGNSFADFFREYMSLPSRNPIELALRRFVLAGETSRPDDRLVDLVTAAESLFLEGAHGELKYRLAMRFAQFCEDADSTGPRLYLFMKDAYDARSGLVHGVATADTLRVRSPKGDVMDFDSFVPLLESLLRSCFAKAIGLVSAGTWPPQWETALLEPWDKNRY